MHDDSLERRLGAALHAEGDSLPFTITADELRRRMAARRRARLGRPGLLLLAAGLGVGLVGLGAAAASWLEHQKPQPSVAPVAEASVGMASASPQPSAPSSPAVTSPRLPTIADFLVNVDPAEIVRAQAVGPETAPRSWSHDLGGRASTTFAAIVNDGEYRLVLACLASGELDVSVLHADRLNGLAPMRFGCDGTTADEALDLHAGDQVVIRATQPTAWRVALLAPGREAPHAASVAADVTKAAGPRLDNSPVESDRKTPDYAATGPAAEPTLVTYLNTRDAYRIAVSCAGPGPLTYELRAPLGISPPVGDGAALSDVATTVECDGGTHVDVVRFPFAIGADVWIDAPHGTAWRFAASWEAPPIQGAQDDGDWKLAVGIGPNLTLDPDVDHGEFTIPRARPVRIVVTCRGGEAVDVVLRNKDGGAETTGTAPCRSDETTVTVIPVDEPGRSFEIETTPHGAMWLAVTVQQAAGGG